MTDAQGESPWPEQLAIRVTAMPRDTNAHGTVFGGYILSLIDQAGAIAAHASGAGKIVTVAMREVEFKAPVHVGDIVTCYGQIVRKGRTSITVNVRVVAHHPIRGKGMPERHVTQAEVVYVQVDEEGSPMPVPAG